MEKTAVEWLIEELGEYFPHEIGGIHLMVNKALKMEKQQIIDAFEGFPLNTRNSQNGQEYYTETYKKAKHGENRNN